MDRRKSLKILTLGSVSAGVLVDACTTNGEKKTTDVAAKPEFNYDRATEELERDKKLLQEKFFTQHEMETIAILCDIIIPADEVSGSATQAGVPDFIEFIVKDQPNNQLPMRGGLQWLDIQCLKQYSKTFKDCSETQRIEMVDKIAYPQKALPEMKQGVSFFNLMRNLTASGFYTSEMGVKDIGYMGNVASQWNGVPDDVLKQYNIAYSEKELKECVKF